MRQLIIFLINLIHLFLFIIPVLIFWLPKSIMKPIGKYVLLVHFNTFTLGIFRK